MTRGVLRAPARARVAAALIAACLLLAGCAGQSPSEGANDSGVQVLIDGAAWDGRALPIGEGELRVIITLDGQALIELPFDTPRAVTVRQAGVGENTVTLTGEAVYMSHADCENQDCVNMGEVTPQNMELRVLGGFIVCLPHRLSVEVRGE